MTVKLDNLVEKLDLTVICGSLDRQATGVYAGDLLSWVMSHARQDDVWVTIMSNTNVIAVASLVNVACVILSEGVTLSEEDTKLAIDREVTVLTTSLSTYEVCAEIAKFQMCKINYDFHIHSCLSPCADDDMTPANIVGMAMLNGLDAIALTDHNSTKNCPAFVSECRKNNIIPICGMELTTSEDVHMVCLFPKLENAMSFGEQVDLARLPYQNKPQVFGNQIIYNEDDEAVGEEDILLINAVSISIDECFELCTGHGGICYPAHIERSANGIVSTLGVFPDEPDFKAFEITSRESLDSYKKLYEKLDKISCVMSSDAHHLWDISEGENTLEIESIDNEEIAVKSIFDRLVGKK